MTDGNEELKIIMVALRGMGKTSLLAAMHEEFYKTFERANLQTWIDDNNTLRAIQECKSVLKNIDAKLENKVTPTQAKENPWNDQGFSFELGSSGKKFMKLRFTDPSGEYFNSDATNEYKQYVKRQLNECDAVVIPIDATALMQKKTGKVNHAEIGTWHEEKNSSQRITQLLKDAYTNVTSPRLVILAPVKCETYTKTPRDAERLLYHVKIGYSELLDFFKSDSLIDKVAVVITPVQTIGNVVFSYAKTDNVGYTKFCYHKTPINAPYEPKDGDQPLRYILLFLINVFLEKKKEILKKEQENLTKLTSDLGKEKYKLDTAKIEFDEKQRLLNERNNTWWLARTIFNIFDDRQPPYYKAKGQFEQKEVENQEIQSNVESTSLKVQATQEEINAFNNALYKFAIGCKNNDGFAVVQGHKWFNFPQSIF
ncbi:TRAFAC clade GTPase domain-containing protein [Nostoc sp.]|uniref:TRAFAC clade GTPase domain-containing protein n=1 Tax=Nostoc sp. TaxID=1180 RepID=UPI002FFA14D7